MAETTASDKAPASKSGGWFKTILGIVMGLFSGAFMMYFSGIVNQVVKPAKPVANFEVQKDGLTVIFLNRSSQGEGWVDFGDGSSLEPISAGQEKVVHTYSTAGTYTAKVTLRNFLNDEHERSVPVHLEKGPNDKPEVLSLEVVPVSPGSFAPATFRVTGKAKNAQLCVWNYDDEGPRPLEVASESPNQQDRLVTFTRPGTYTIKFAALSGKDSATKTALVTVAPAPSGSVTAILRVSEQATQVDKLETPFTFTETFAANAKGNTQPIARDFQARAGYEIVEAKLDPSVKGVKNLKAAIAADKKSVKVTGELQKDGGGVTAKGGATPPTIKIVLTQEKRTPVNRSVPVTANLSSPGSATLEYPPTPAGWANVTRQAKLELREGAKVVLPADTQTQLPKGMRVALTSRVCEVTATPTKEGVKVDLN